MDAGILSAHGIIYENWEQGEDVTTPCSDKISLYLFKCDRGRDQRWEDMLWTETRWIIRTSSVVMLTTVWFSKIFLLIRGTFGVSCLPGEKVRFHQVSDVRAEFTTWNTVDLQHRETERYTNRLKDRQRDREKYTERDREGELFETDRSERLVDILRVPWAIMAMHVSGRSPIIVTTPVISALCAYCLIS